MTGPGINGALTDQPFTVAPSEAPNIAHTGTIALAGRRYVLDPTKGFVRETLDMRRSSQDQGAQPGQQTLTDAGLWHRFAIDWSLGAGQQHFDRTDSADRRFLSSKGLNPWTRGELTLLHDTTLIDDTTEGNLDMVSVGGYVYWADGELLKRSSNPYDASPTITSVGGGGGRIHSFTTDGATVYVMRESDTYAVSAGSDTLTPFTSTFGGDLIGYANGRLLGARGPRLVEIDSAGVAGGDNVLDYTHPNASFQWVSVASAPNAIYVAGYVGDRSEIYAILPDTNTGGLRVPVFADALPDGEIVNVIAHYGSLIVMGTNRGIRCGQVSGNASIIHGPVVEIGGGGVYALEPQGEFMWFSWSNYDSTSTGLGRLGLAELTEPLVPAYASDLMATTQGRVVGIATLGDRRCFTVVGAGAYAETATLVASGTLDQGEVSWSTFALKSIAALDVRHAPLQGRVVASTVDEHGTVRDAGASADQSALGPSAPFDVTDVHGESMHPTVRLERADTTHGPSLRRASISAVVRPKRQDTIILPLVWRSIAVDRDGVEWTMDTAEEMRFLKSVEASGRIVDLQVGDDVFRVQIDKITQQWDRLLQAEMDWNDTRTGFEGIVLVQCITQEAGI